MAGRPNTLAERRLVAEYTARKWPGRTVMEDVRLGQIPAEVQATTLTAKQAAMVGLWRRYCDAIILDPPTMIILEGVMVPKAGKVSQLELYMMLAPVTPSLQAYANWQVQGYLLLAVDDPVIRALAAQRGILVDVYHPSWVDLYLATLPHRKRRAVLPPPSL